MAVDLDAALEQVMGQCRADAVELFLTLPSGSDVVLAAQVGFAERAFRERTRFARGEGFPGLVAASEAPLVCPDLPTDRRYLRPAVTAKGFKSYLCVPVRGRSYLGSLHAVFRRHVDGTQELLDVLSDAAMRLGMAIELERLGVANRLRDFVFDKAIDPQANYQAAARTVLEVLVDGSGAIGGMVLVPDGVRFAVAAEMGLPPAALRWTGADIPPGCPVQGGSPCVTQEKGCAWLSPVCRAVARGFDSTACLPLSPKRSQASGMAGMAATDVDRSAGVVVLGFESAQPLPAFQLRFLHEALPLASALLANAQYVTYAATGASRVAGVAHESRLQEPDVLDLRCLGPFRMAWGGAAIPAEAFRRHQALTLLKVVLAAQGQPVHRDAITSLLWPGEGTDLARRHLAMALHRLREVFAGSCGAEVVPVRRYGEEYCFDREVPHKLDLTDFKAEASSGDSWARQGEAQKALAAYHQAASLYAGPLFQDDPDSEWCASERAICQDLYLNTLRSAAELQARAGDHHAAIASYREALRADPSPEDLHAGLIRALFRAGRRTEALQQYEVLRAQLERDFATVPLPGTRSLYDEIVLAGRPGSHASS